MVVRTPVTSPIFKKQFANLNLNVNPLSDADLKSAGAFASPISNYIPSQSRWVQLAVLSALVSKKHIYIHGKAGTGKDALCQQLANQYRIPFINLSFKEGVDVNEWIVRREIKAEQGGFSSKVEEGVLLKAIKGLDKDGKKYPYMILISDMDRALPSQLEVLRQALQEGTSSYLINPVSGEPVNVMAGTVFVLTGNSALDGDIRGNMITSRIDASILNRMVCIRANNPDRNHFVKIISSEFPSLSESECDLLVSCMEKTTTVSEELALPIEISIRTIKAWARLALDAYENKIVVDFKSGLQFAFDGVIDGFFSNPLATETLRGAIDHLIGGSVEAVENQNIMG